MSNSGSAYIDSASFTSDRKQTQSVAQDILYQQQPKTSSKTMPDNASLNSYSSTASTLKSKLKPSSWTTKKVQDQALKTQGRKDNLKWPIFPGSPGPNSYL